MSSEEPARGVRAFVAGGRRRVRGFASLLTRGGGHAEDLARMDPDAGDRWRIRRRAGLAVSAVSVASAAGVAAVVVVLMGQPGRTPSTGPVDAASAVRSMSLGRLHPPIGPVAVLAGPRPGAVPAGQSVVAWAAGGGVVCLGSMDLDLDRAATDPLVMCGPGQLDQRAASAPVLSAKPVFRAGPLVSGAVLAVGFTRAPAASVAVTMFGATTVAGTHPIGTADDEAYAVWLPLPSGRAASWSAVTGLTALDASGRVIASLP